MSTEAALPGQMDFEQIWEDAIGKELNASENLYRRNVDLLHSHGISVSGLYYIADQIAKWSEFNNEAKQTYGKYLKLFHAHVGDMRDIEKVLSTTPGDPCYSGLKVKR